MRKSRRNELLAAAFRVVTRDGAAALTLDAVAAEAGASKGGVLYHFPSKDALITGMIESLAAIFEGSLQRHLEAPDRPPGRWLRAYLGSSLEEEQYAVDVQAGLAAALAHQPRLLAPLRDSYECWQERACADGLDPVVATLVRLAVDGLWFADLFDLAPPRGNLRRDVVRALHDMTRRVDHA